jgi:hypothetical protein
MQNSSTDRIQVRRSWRPRQPLRHGKAQWNGESNIQARDYLTQKFRRITPKYFKI